jgi:DNA-binding NarL/FixJ family response regulator
MVKQYSKAVRIGTGNTLRTFCSTRRKVPLRLVVVSSSPIFAAAMQQLLEGGTDSKGSPAVPATEWVGPAGFDDPDALVVVPQDWGEFARWLPGLRSRFPRHPWLLLADPRLVGMFLSFFEAQPCVPVASTASSDELEAALVAVVQRRFPNLPAELCARFSRGAIGPKVGRPSRPPSATELQCGCAVSLGLRNREIAEVLHLSEGTVKSHVHHLLRKLNMEDRWELASVIQRALAPFPSPMSWN